MWLTVPRRVYTNTIPVTWGATDTSGVARYDLDVRVEDGDWTPWLTDTLDTEATYALEEGEWFSFRVTATDNVSNGASTEALARFPRVTKYYYHGGRRVAQRRDGVVYYLHGDHLGSTSLVTGQTSNVVARQLFRPYGDTRYQAGTLPTDFGFAGQREDGSTGLLFMHARYYDARLGRFVQADTVVPEAGNPQVFNRYSYAVGNPVKYSDPTGYYSEDEIMQAFGSSTWDEVLTFFKEGGELEGKWSWLEVLRQADNSDWVTGSIYDKPHYSTDEFDLPEIGRIYMGSDGEITIGGVAQTEFATRWARYSLDSAVHGEYHFSTDAETIHWHPRFVSGNPDWTGVCQDVTSMLFDYFSAAALVNMEAGGANLSAVYALQVMRVSKDAIPAMAGGANILNYRSTGQFDSSDVLDTLGVIPFEHATILGWASLGSNLSGIRVKVTP